MLRSVAAQTRISRDRIAADSIDQNFATSKDISKMHFPNRLRELFVGALAGFTDTPEKYAGMIRPTTDPKFGDYQSNCAMPLAKQSDGKSSRDVAADLVGALNLGDSWDSPEVAGPGFINLKLQDGFLASCLKDMLKDDRCLVPAAAEPKKILVDFSSPNVAKPMHVGHIRSTVIGDSLTRVIRFLGHHVTTDNHLGDWGTQFGIIIYGYKNFGDPDVVAGNPVPELAKLYRLTNQLIEFHKAKESLGTIGDQIAQAEQEFASAKAAAEQAEGKEAKKLRKAASSAEKKTRSLESQRESAQQKVDAVQSDPELAAKAVQHAGVGAAVLAETVKLHEGDKENLELWESFLPHCKDEINRVYDRLNVKFDFTLGESFYHSMLAGVVTDLQSRGLAQDSEGAVCVFLPEFDAPMIVRKQDGAFLYATTDLATLKYRLSEFDPAEILYVVDTRQSEHFDKLFAVADRIGMDAIKLVHVNFGTVLGEDGRPMKTRSGTLIGLEGLLDDAVERARQVVCDPARLVKFDPPMDGDEQQLVSETVGIGAIKYADLSHHRTSDYKFNLSKMVALEGNTSTYVQYSYARTQSILRKASESESSVAAAVAESGIVLEHPAERALGLMLLKLEEALLATYHDYAPNQLSDYLYETAKAYAVFNDQCPVIKAASDQSRVTRLALVVLCGRVLDRGLGLLGIGVVPRM